MFRRYLFLAMLLCLTLSAHAERTEGGGGLLYGQGWSFGLKAPPGWIFDTESGARQGVHAVMYPVGSTWKDSTVVIYGGASPKEGESMEAVIQSDEAAFRARSPGLKIEEQPPLSTSDQRVARVRKFTGDTFGNFELVAYIDSPEHVLEIVLSARDEEAFRIGAPAFEKVVASFFFLARTP